MPPTLDYAVYDTDVEDWGRCGCIVSLEDLARIAARRVAWKVAAAWRIHMEVGKSHPLPSWLQDVLEAQAPD